LCSVSLLSRFGELNSKTALLSLEVVDLLEEAVFGVGCLNLFVLAGAGICVWDSRKAVSHFI